MRVYFVVLFSAITLFLFQFPLRAQTDGSWGLKIDSLFSDWNSETRPGGIVAIAINGRVEYVKAFGLANLEYKIPIQKTTVFNIRGLSKVFTAIAVNKLVFEHKLKLTDDAAPIILDFPQVGSKISIQSLLNHTSGLRDINALLRMCGYQLNEPRGMGTFFSYMSGQKSLNFNPGSEYHPSDSDYIILTEIIKFVGKTDDFDLWMKRNVFDPLGLTTTFIENDPNAVVSNKAYQYYMEEEPKNVAFQTAYIGTDNVYSTVGDLLAVLNNFHDVDSPWSGIFNQMTKTDTLSDGSFHSYNSGFSIDSIHGKLAYSALESGNLMVSFPGERLDIVILTNTYSSLLKTKLLKATQILLDIEQNLPAETVKKEDSFITGVDFSQHTGSYWNEKLKMVKRLYLANDTLKMVRYQGHEVALEPISINKFHLIGSNEGVAVRFDSINGKKIMVLQPRNRAAELWENRESHRPEKEDLLEYAGNYSCEETACEVQLMHMNTLFLHQKKGNPLSAVIPKFKDVFINYEHLGYLEFERDDRGKIIGFYASTPMARNLWFKRLNKW